MSGSSDDGFLSRWSRRKREAAQAETRADEPSVTRPLTRPLAGPQQSGAGSHAESNPATAQSREALSPEDELARFDPSTFEIPLPSLDDLKPGDSLKAFMQRGVPMVIRNAALRKMWALDPMVRDFRSEALDYAYDWNAPGGIPGISEPLAPNDRVSEMVDALFRKREGEAQEVVEVVDTQEAQTRQEGQEPQQTATEGVKDPPIGDEDRDRPAPTIPSPRGEPEGPKAEKQGFPAEKPVEKGEMPRKRHGGAMPQV